MNKSFAEFPPSPVVAELGWSLAVGKIEAFVAELGVSGDGARPELACCAFAASAVGSKDGASELAAGRLKLRRLDAACGLSPGVELAAAVGGKEGLGTPPVGNIFCGGLLCGVVVPCAFPAVAFVPAPAELDASLLAAGLKRLAKGFGFGAADVLGP